MGRGGGNGERRAPKGSNDNRDKRADEPGVRAAARKAWGRFPTFRYAQGGALDGALSRKLVGSQGTNVFF